MTWQAVPAQTVREVIGDYAGHYPPTLEEMEAILLRFNFKVCYVPPRQQSEAITLLKRRRVYVPWFDDESETLRQLLHETAEVLLRYPVAPEFYYIPTGEDEFHNVALLVEEGMNL